eukprot:SAG25_NODE_112_length_14924_cov_13.606476_8_plen_79_part_00
MPDGGQGDWRTSVDTNNRCSSTPRSSSHPAKPLHFELRGTGVGIFRGVEGGRRGAAVWRGRRGRAGDATRCLLGGLCT